MARNGDPVPARPTKLRSGAWGARVDGEVLPGDPIIITAKSGKTWPAVVRRVYWSGDGLSIVAADGTDEQQPAARPRLSLTCPTCQRPGALSRAEAAKGYQCSRCADAEEGVGFGA